MQMFTSFRQAKKYIVIGLFVVIAGLFAGFKQNDFEIAKNLDIFYSLFREVTMFYVDETDPAKLIEDGINGMLKELDPYTNFIPESRIEDFRFMQTGEYGGIGALFRKRGNKVYIVDPYEDSPALKAGLKAGDVILEVEGQSVEGKSFDDLSEFFKGQPGTQIQVKIERPGVEGEMDFTLTREKIEIKSVPHYQMLNDDVGYVKLNSFTMQAFSEMSKAIKDLKENKGASSMVIDLRGNPGGLLIEAVKIVNLFIDKNQEVVSTRGKVDMHNKSYKTLTNPYDTLMPIAVLVNSKSASASEIVSGALQDLDRGVIIGTRTFGKGLVQQTRDLSYNTKLKVTTAKYYIPSGRCIQALDYSHRNPDGSVGKVPDSLMTEFATRNGRKVFDGGGVVPDILVENEYLSAITSHLFAQDIIFDFVTAYCINTDSVNPPESFVLEDTGYDHFKDYVLQRNFEYTTQSEKQFENLVASAKKEKYFEKNKTQFDAIEAALSHDVGRDLDHFKEEISLLISEEIINRYYHKKGSLMYQLKEDKMVEKAIEVLGDEATYKGILAGTVNAE